MCCRVQSKQLSHMAPCVGEALISPLVPACPVSVRLPHCVCRYASFDYEEAALRPADLMLLELLVNGKPVDALARLVPSGACCRCHVWAHLRVAYCVTRPAPCLSCSPAWSGDAVRAGRALAARMRDLLERQQYEVAIQVRASAVCRSWAHNTAAAVLHAGRGVLHDAALLDGRARTRRRLPAAASSLARHSRRCARTCWQSATAAT